MRLDYDAHEDVGGKTLINEYRQESEDSPTRGRTLYHGLDARDAEVLLVVLRRYANYVYDGQGRKPKHHGDVFHYTVPLYTPLPQFVQTAVEIAQYRKQAVEFDFQGVKMVVNGDTSVDEAVEILTRRLADQGKSDGSR